MWGHLDIEPLWLYWRFEVCCLPLRLHEPSTSIKQPINPERERRLCPGQRRGSRSKPEPLETAQNRQTTTTAAADKTVPARAFLPCSDATASLFISGLGRVSLSAEEEERTVSDLNFWNVNRSRAPGSRAAAPPASCRRPGPHCIFNICSLSSIVTYLPLQEATNGWNNEYQVKKVVFKAKKSSNSLIATCSSTHSSMLLIDDFCPFCPDLFF